MISGFSEQPSNENSGSADQDGSNGSLTEEKKAEIAALKQKMAEQKEESKDDKDPAENFRLMRDSLNSSRNKKRRQTAIFQQQNHKELWTPNELTPVLEDDDIDDEEFQPKTF